MGVSQALLDELDAYIRKVYVGEADVLQQSFQPGDTGAMAPLASMPASRAAASLPGDPVLAAPLAAAGAAPTEAFRLEAKKAKHKRKGLFGRRQKRREEAASDEQSVFGGLSDESSIFGSPAHESFRLDERDASPKGALGSEAAAQDLAALEIPPISQSLEERLATLDESFAQTVLRLIDERGMDDVEVYKRANMSRQLFAKIRKDDAYRPTKKTACALAFALGLDYEDTLALLSRAGFTLSHSSKFDVIVEYFLVNNIHDIFQVNEALFAYDQPILG